MRYYWDPIRKCAVPLGSKDKMCGKIGIISFCMKSAVRLKSTANLELNILSPGRGPWKAKSPEIPSHLARHRTSLPQNIKGRPNFQVQLMSVLGRSVAVLCWPVFSIVGDQGARYVAKSLGVLCHVGTRFPLWSFGNASVPGSDLLVQLPVQQENLVT